MESSRQNELIRLKGFAQKWIVDHQKSQKHVKISQKSQNTNRYSMESYRQNEWICLKGLAQKLDFDHQKCVKSCQNVWKVAKSPFNVTAARFVFTGSPIIFSKAHKTTYGAGVRRSAFV